MAHHANEEHWGRPTNFTMMQFFEWYAEGKGVHWKKYASETDRLASMGITACWIPPPTKGSSVDGTGYDIYDIWDLGEFDQKGAQRTNWGTKEELLAAIKTAADKGIVTYIDAVMNHKAGADDKEEFLAIMVDQNNRKKEIGEMHNIEGWTKFTFPGRGDKHSPMKWNFNHFTGVDYDAKTETTAIFRIQGDGKSWASDVDKENGGYDYLMFADVDHSHPDVAQEYFNWGNWILKETGAHGFRFDAVKHISQQFIGDFVKKIRSQESGRTKAFCVGEFWKDSTDTLIAYLDGLGTQFSCFDCVLQANFKEAGEARASYDLRKIFDDTLVQRRPIDAVTLVDNHDTQVGQSLQRWVPSWFKPLAYALILLRVDGYPCVFYGDLYGCGGENPQEPVNQLEDIVRCRKLFAYGELVDHWDHANCLAWVRKGDEEHDGCVVVLCNGTDEGTKHCEVGKEHAGEKWTDVLGWHQGEVTIGEDGWADFSCPAESLSIWAKVDAKGREEFKKQ
ncbi:putative alpha-amylase [Kockovaella imperatae]|uniref:Putative alpha-amylase n=1 Tax=Kockovaella imperatae TaxID=4999 RepID=A0A1Y1USS0_9TREE|nr:putative alpha-amylase [Kockovaella imperatae]ORX40476.1 putative alpha-amylase [Kockovaella imperatae]